MPEQADDPCLMARRFKVKMRDKQDGDFQYLELVAFRVEVNLVGDLILLDIPDALSAFGMQIVTGAVAVGTWLRFIEIEPEPEPAIKSGSRLKNSKDVIF